MKDHIELTEMPVNYTGHHSRMEVMEFSPDIHDKPGVYLQYVEGCGYTVYNLTPDEARFLGECLIRKAKETMKAFSKAGKPHIP